MDMAISIALWKFYFRISILLIAVIMEEAEERKNFSKIHQKIPLLGTVGVSAVTTKCGNERHVSVTISPGQMHVIHGTFFVEPVLLPASCRSCGLSISSFDL
jgi:hypothetical protein